MPTRRAFDAMWSGFPSGLGPLGDHCVAGEVTHDPESESDGSGRPPMFALVRARHKPSWVKGIFCREVAHGW